MINLICVINFHLLRQRSRVFSAFLPCTKSYIDETYEMMKVGERKQISCATFTCTQHLTVKIISSNLEFNLILMNFVHVE